LRPISKLSVNPNWRPRDGGPCIGYLCPSLAIGETIVEALVRGLTVAMNRSSRAYDGEGSTRQKDHDERGIKD
jgi:hypothetical protein